jgi:hypothetical protein
MRITNGLEERKFRFPGEIHSIPDGELVTGGGRIDGLRHISPLLVIVVIQRYFMSCRREESILGSGIKSKYGLGGRDIHCKILFDIFAWCQ